MPGIQWKGCHLRGSSFNATRLWYRILSLYKNRSENLKIVDLTLYLLSRLGPTQNCPKSTLRLANSSFFLSLGMLLAAEPYLDSYASRLNPACNEQYNFDQFCGR